ncbi:MAG: hypothetical protein WC476_09985 [Phycisphaerae bacterium]|jgi:Tol biopolymer transport system component
MENYSTKERMIARALDSFPALRGMAKWTYQRLNYFLCRDGVALKLNPRVRMVGLPEEAEHFFGYFDKCCWSPDEKQILYHRVRLTNIVEIVIYDIQLGTNRVVAVTNSWNWQQGAMAQWWPGRGSEWIAFNTVDNDRLVCHIHDTENGNLIKVLPMPIQAVSPRGDYAISLNYTRLARLRPDYGYEVDVVNLKPDMSDESDGLWLIDVSAEQVSLVLSLDDLRQNQSLPSMQKAQHKVNHVVFSPDGQRIAFMHRWTGKNGKFSRLYTACPDGSELCLLADNRMVSHYCWRDTSHLLAWARKDLCGDRYLLFTDKTPHVEIFGEDIIDMHGDGHPSFSPNGRWLITDTYPGRDRKRALLLYDTLNRNLFLVGQFFSPWQFNDTTRCDLHPRWSPDGNWIAIDSAHTYRRGLYLIDVKGLLVDDAKERT